jgi:hypothetical protein
MTITASEEFAALEPLYEPTRLQECVTMISLLRQVDRCGTSALNSEAAVRVIPRPVRRVGSLLAAIVAAVVGSLSTANAEEVCHLAGEVNQVTLDVAPADVADHLAHGDSLGPCYPPQVEVPYTCSSSSLAYEKLFVRSGATPPMQGTVDRPFSTVSAALKYAARRGLGAVEVQVAPGSYGPDSAEISRPTRIVGPGRDAKPTAELALSIDHRSSHELGVQGLLFRPNGLAPALTVRTDAAADDPRGHTALCNIGYAEIVGHSVAQVGGSISADDIIVRNTRRHPDETFLNVLSGTAFIFGGGLGGSIDALLENSFVFDSEGSGVVASGFGTIVGLNKVAISGGQGCWGAVYVSNVAELYGRHVRIGGVRSPDDPLTGALPKDPNDPSEWPIDIYGIEGLDHVGGQPILLTGNRMFGVYGRGTTVLSGSDTSAEIYDLVVRNTSQNGNEAEECGFRIPSSIAAFRGADITVDRFILDASALIGVLVGEFGLIIFDEWFGTTVNLSNGVVSNNPIGANVQPADYPFNTFQGTVLWLNNGINLDAEFVPVPEPEQDIGSL